MRKRRGGSAVVAAVLAGAALGCLPAVAHGTATCNFNASTHQLAIKWTESTDNVSPYLDGADIVVPNYGAPGGTLELVCTPDSSPTVDNVDRITYRDKSGRSSSAGVYQPDTFTPGATDAGGDAGSATNEIEFRVIMKSGRKDSFNLGGSNEGPLSLVLGSHGVDVNATPAQVSPDVDVTMSGLEKAHIDNEGDWTDSIDGRGGMGTGGASPLSLTIEGYGGNDFLFGGSGDDDIRGGDGVDNMRSFKGDDSIDAQDGQADGAIKCGPGDDEAEVDPMDPPAKSC